MSILDKLKEVGKALITGKSIPVPEGSRLIQGTVPIGPASNPINAVKSVASGIGKTITETVKSLFLKPSGAISPIKTTGTILTAGIITANPSLPKQIVEKTFSAGEKLGKETLPKPLTGGLSSIEGKEIVVTPQGIPVTEHKEIPLSLVTGGAGALLGAGVVTLVDKFFNKDVPSLPKSKEESSSPPISLPNNPLQDLKTTTPGRETPAPPAFKSKNIKRKKTKKIQQPMRIIQKVLVVAKQKQNVHY